MRFRVLRSKAFWFGVLGLVFLLWAWGVSYGYRTVAGFGGRDQAKVAQLGGDVYVRWSTRGFPDFGKRGFIHEAERREVIASTKQAMRKFMVIDPAFCGIVIPYYALILGYVLAWAGLVVWRARRYRAAGAGTEGKA